MLPPEAGPKRALSEASCGYVAGHKLGVLKSWLILSASTTLPVEESTNLSGFTVSLLEGDASIDCGVAVGCMSVRWVQLVELTRKLQLKHSKSLFSKTLRTNFNLEVMDIQLLRVWLWICQ